MKHGLALSCALSCALSLVLTACGVEGAEPEEGQRVSGLKQQEEEPPQVASCSNVWMCDEVCGYWYNGQLIRYSTNVLHRYCDDGSDTVVQTNACGELCY